jgi:tetratricopeptide (TPR) repeat protein
LTYQRNSVWTDEVELWRDSVEKSPKKIRTTINLGLAYLGKGMPEKAEESFREVLSTKPRHYKALHYLSEALFKQGRYREAISVLESISKEYETAFTTGVADPLLRRRMESLQIEDHTLYYETGLCYYRLQEYDNALSEFQKALGRSPSNPSVINLIAMVYYARGEYAEAEKKWKEVLSLDPEFGLAHESLGLLYLKEIPDRRMAVHHLRETLRFFPEHPSREWIKKKLGEVSGPGIP